MVARADRCPGHAAVRSRQSQERTGAVNLEDSQAASSRQERASATVIAETWQIGVHDPGTPLLLRSEAAERLNGSESTVVRPGRAGAITEIRVGKRAPPQEGSRMSSADARTAQCDLPAQRCGCEERPACLAGREAFRSRHRVHHAGQFRLEQPPELTDSPDGPLREPWQA